jgi:hypothetical protein
MRSREVLFSFVLVGSMAVGQVTATVGPSPAPPGGLVGVTIVNDTAATVTLADPCSFQVRDSSGMVIFHPPCIQVPANLFPGAVLANSWPQQDDNAQQVAAGTYTVDVFLPAGTVSTAVTIAPNVQAAMTTIGPTRIGKTRQLFLTSPQDGGFPYVVGASGPPVSGGIPTCHGLVPLEVDAILMLSLGPNPFFSNFTGTLDFFGNSPAPLVTVPNDPTLIGVSFNLAFVTLAPNAACPVRSISAPFVNTIL